MHKPEYYDSFSCSAGSCPDTCCRAGWLIPLDSETFDLYRTVDADISENTFTDSDGDRVFRLRPDRSCHYLNPDGLCALYIKTGGRLCEICSKYPRFFEEYDGFAETGLSVSCPTAAALILSRSDNPYRDLKRDTPDELLGFLCRARERVFEMIFSEPDPDAALQKLVFYGAELQELIDYGELGLLSEADFSGALEPVANLSESRRFILENTEILSEKWRELLKSGCKAPCGSPSERRNYLAYLVYRYFLKAVNTEDVFTECRFIGLLYRLAASLGGNYVEAVKLVSREIEHDSENVEALLGYLSRTE